MHASPPRSPGFEHPRRRLLLRGAVALAVVVVGFVLLLPTICSSVVVPGIIRAAVASQVDGTVTISGTSFSWFGSQEIGSIGIESGDRGTKLDASVTIGRSLLGLLFDRSDLGSIDLTLQGRLRLASDGSTTLFSTTQPTDATDEDAGNRTRTSGRGSDADAGLPAGFRMDLALSVPQLEVSVEGLEGALKVSGLTTTTEVAAGGSVKLELSGALAANGRSGTVSGRFELDNGIARNGRLQLADATLEGAFDATDLELPAGDAWVGITSLTLKANSTALSRGTTIRGEGSGTLSNSDPIAFSTSLDLGSLVSSDGGFQLGPDSVSGTVKATSIPSTLVQPFLGGTPIRLARDVGPRLDLALDAGNGSPRSVTLGLKAERMNVDASFSVTDTLVSDGSMKATWALPAELLEDYGVTSLAGGAGKASGPATGLEFVASGVGLKLDPDGAPVPGSLAGSFTLTNQGRLAARGVTMSDLDARVTTTGLAGGVDLNLAAELAGSKLNATGQFTGLLSEGGLDPAGATARGTISAKGIDPGALEQLLGEALPPDTLAMVTGGPANLDLKLDYQEQSGDIEFTLGAPDLSGTGKATFSASTVALEAVRVEAGVQPKLVQALRPGLGPIEALAGKADLVVTSDSMSYRLDAPADTPPRERITGNLTATARRVDLRLAAPAERLQLGDLDVEVELNARQALVLNTKGDVSVQGKPVGSLSCMASIEDLARPTSAKLDARADLKDVAALARLAGTDPAPLLVLVGSSASVTLEAPANEGTADTVRLNGTIESSKARGTFNAVANADLVETLKLGFATTLRPGDLHQALGAKGGVRLGNQVSIRLEGTLAGLPLSGGAMTGLTATGTIAADPMELSGDNDSRVRVRDVKGTLDVRNGDLTANFDARIVGRDGTTGDGSVTMRTSATLPKEERPFSLGDTVIQLESVPTFIFELAGANGRIAEAALGATVDSQATLTTTGDDRRRLTMQLKSPFADARLPSASIESTLVEISRGDDLEASLTVSPQLGREVLSVIHPIFADISSSEKPITLDVGPLTLPLEGDQAARLDGAADLEIGRVTLRSTDFGSRMLSLLGNQKTDSIPATFSPLKITARKGVIEYSDFVMELGEQASTRARRKLIFDGKIDLAADPPTVIGISATFPAEWIKGSFKELDKVPPALLDTIRPKVTFYGPLYDKSGKRIPLKTRIDPINLKDGLKPEAVPGLIKGIGDLINKNRDR